MPSPLQSELDALAAVLGDPDRLVRAVAAGRRRAEHPRWRRAELRPVELNAGRRLQVVTFDERQAFTANHEYGPDADAAVAALLAEPFGNWHVDTEADPADPRTRPAETIALRVTKRGEAQVHRAPRASHTPRTASAGTAALASAAPAAPAASHQGAPNSLLVKPERPHDRAKRRLLPPDAPVLRELGLADAQGRIKPSRQAKYRQIEDFLRQLAVVTGTVPHEGAPASLEANPGHPDARRGGGGGGARALLRVADLGCGNAYLTFGAYAYLTDRSRASTLGGIEVPEATLAGGEVSEAMLRGGEVSEPTRGGGEVSEPTRGGGEAPEVTLVGVDVREDSRRRNTELAARLGWDAHVRFVAGAIDTVQLDPPDVVLALHACDTATDDALVRAVRWQSPIVLAAPCCHHDLQRRIADRIAASGPPAPYGLVTRHGLLRERFADVLTDALRAAVLRMLGYRVDVVEFVDSKHTPRNAMLRAVRTGAPPSAELVADYRALVEQWQVTPYLANALADELRPVLGPR